MCRSVIHYYVALKLCAGSVGPMFGPQFENPPAPMVRRCFRQSDAHWDPREIVSVGGRTGVLTLPHGDGRISPGALIVKN